MGPGESLKRDPGVIPPPQIRPMEQDIGIRGSPVFALFGAPRDLRPQYGISCREVGEGANHARRQERVL